MSVFVEERVAEVTVESGEIAAAFSAEMEREVCERVLGDRRHG